MTVEASAKSVQNSATGGNSYGQILRSSSIIGGATGINYVMGMKS
ncbi:MAG: hypothetical protein ACO3JG_12335 [Luteolibacter sp.]